ncbi:MAG TPA: SRPBCC family protein [Thermoanaerobaculia bacterium]|nr:SRPBCC family protein [Thermoanaerobaculia bacterium]
MRFSYAVHIQAPMEEVFALLTDPEKTGLWTEGLEENVFPEGYDREHPVGTRFRQAIRESDLLSLYEGEVTAYERPGLYGVRLVNQRLAVDVVYRLAPDRNGTRLVYSADVRHASWLERLATRLFSHLTEGVIRNQMRRLKQVVESGGQPVPPPQIDFGW